MGLLGGWAPYLPICSQIQSPSFSALLYVWGGVGWVGEVDPCKFIP